MLEHNKKCQEYGVNFYNGATQTTVKLLNGESIIAGFKSAKGSYPLPANLVESLINDINRYGINEENHKKLSVFYDQVLKTIAELKYPSDKYKHTAWDGRIDIYTMETQLVSPIKNRYQVTR